MNGGVIVSLLPEQAHETNQSAANSPRRAIQPILQQAATDTEKGDQKRLMLVLPATQHAHLSVHITHSEGASSTLR